MDSDEEDDGEEDEYGPRMQWVPDYSRWDRSMNRHVVIDEKDCNCDLKVQCNCSCLGPIDLDMNRYFLGFYETKHSVIVFRNSIPDSDRDVFACKGLVINKK